MEKELKGQMEEAAEALEFEKAAALRDRLRAITLLGKRQKVVAGYLADTDVLGLYMGRSGSGWRCSTSRRGSSPGGTWRSLHTAGEPAEEILSAFLVQDYYSPGPAAPADSAAGGHGGSGGPGAAALPPGRAEGGADDPQRGPRPT
ncbi:MAG: UvrB/UvrC motif-containing protein [Evtepia gabavorous]